jgi:multiple sugar transport system permease protein
MPQKRNRTSLGRVLTYVLLVLAAFYSFWPILVMAFEGYGIDFSPLFSGKAVRRVGGVPYYSGGIFPTPIFYLDAINLGQFPKLLFNTTVFAGVAIAVALGAGVVAAYALARPPIKGKNLVSYFLLALRTVSPFAVVIPLYVFFTRNGLWDTYLGDGLAEDIVVLSVVVWMLRGFFADIPREIYDAAAIFGATEGQIFRRVALRMVIPGIVVTGLFAWVLIWNDFLISSVLTGPATKSVTVGVWDGLGEFSLRQVSFDDLNAGGFLAWIPAIAVMLGIRKYLAKGYSLGTASSKT